MIDTLLMKISSYTLFGSHSKNYSDFVLKDKPEKKIAVLRKAAKAANADQRKMVKKARSLIKAK
jgi:hypothetical protein